MPPAIRAPVPVVVTAPVIVMTVRVVVTGQTRWNLLQLRPPCTRSLLLEYIGDEAA